MRIATLCGMGFGTSMMLKLFIDDILKAEGIKAEVIPWDLGTFKGQQADIIVAAMDMEMHLRSTTARVVLIRNLVDKAEIRTKVVAAIRELQGAAGSA
ncbi:MAG TPA: PTS sugar transporter subunit IIB [Anaerolineae bacterium]|nr:PTS sugar transporter subunit IIB [Anaerolineae bacterium]HOQ99229.1 PTS sugar transporter subunit IIB [Anaerolineae bacterium]HPL28069.1 PTS sugar transporter subunit IIB [Anaerolineae bacterium]